MTTKYLTPLRVTCPACLSPLTEGHTCAPTPQPEQEQETAAADTISAIITGDTADIQRKVDEAIHARSQRDLPRSQKIPFVPVPEKTTRLFKIESDLPLAGIDRTMSLPEWERIFGYTPENIAIKGGRFLEVSAPRRIDSAKEFAANRDGAPGFQSDTQTTVPERTSRGIRGSGK